ncbi:MAG: 50S ribosomal protein L18e [Candidatus Lokiarchaeota archaeon]|nr:50S ribosomal protein L18e [Candidatus Harpocratesius repetitus]
MTTPTGPSNFYIRKLARKLWKTKRPIWRDVSKRLMAPQKNRVEINLAKINRLTQKGETIIVPGKVLANGTLEKSLTIACKAISKSARDKVAASKSELLTIEELLEKNPTGKGVRIII